MEYVAIIIYLIIVGIVTAIYQKIDDFSPEIGLIIGMLWPIIILASPFVLLIYIGYWITNKII